MGLNLLRMLIVGFISTGFYEFAECRIDPSIQNGNFGNGGRCGQNCFCSSEYRPFCGSDGITYSSICRFNCARDNCNQNLKVRFEGVCPKKYEGSHYRTTKRPTASKYQTNDPKCNSCACPYNFDPVCGSDGVSYGNKCLFRCAQKMCNQELRVQPRKNCG